MLCYIPREYMYLDMLHVFLTRIPKESKIHLGYISDTSRYMYLSCFLCVTLDTYQDTSGSCILDSSSRYIRIHRDTYPRMYPFVSDMYRECILCVMYLRIKLHCSPHGTPSTPPSRKATAPLPSVNTDALAWNFCPLWYTSTCASKQLSTSRKLY